MLFDKKLSGRKKSISVHLEIGIIKTMEIVRGNSTGGGLVY